MRAVQTQFPQAHTHLLHSIWVSAPSSNTSSSRAHSSSHTHKKTYRYFCIMLSFFTVTLCVSAWAWHYFSRMDGRWVSCSWRTQLNSASSLRFHPTARSEHQHTETWDTHTHTHTECCLITICWANHNKSNVQFRPLVEFLVTDYIFCFQPRGNCCLKSNDVFLPQQQVHLQSVGVREVEGCFIMFQEVQELFGVELWIPVVVHLKHANAIVFIFHNI